MAPAATLDRMLDAAESCFDRFGADKTSMEEVATEAGLSRGYVYKLLGSRDALLLAVLERRARRFNERARRFLASRDDLADALVDGILMAVAMADRDPYFGRLVGWAVFDTANPLPGAPAAALALTDELWRPRLECADGAGQLAAGIDIDDAVAWIMQLQVSLLATRRTLGHDEATQARQLRTLLVPALCRHLQPTVRSRQEGSR